MEGTIPAAVQVRWKRRSESVGSEGPRHQRDHSKLTWRMRRDGGERLTGGWRRGGRKAVDSGESTPCGSPDPGPIARNNATASEPSPWFKAVFGKDSAPTGNPRRRRRRGESSTAPIHLVPDREVPAPSPTGSRASFFQRSAEAESEGIAAKSHKNHKKGERRVADVMNVSRVWKFDT